LKDWPSLATTDEEEIERLWQRWPDANLGIKLGPASGLVDCEHDTDEGKATAERLLGDCFTPTYQSSRSIHRLFQFPEGLTIPKAVVMVQGLELRFGTEKKGAQSVFPPSIHASGVQYRWLNGLSPDDVEPLPFPEPLASLLTEAGSTGKPLGDSQGGPMEFVCEGDLENHPGSPEGERNGTLCRLVGRYLGQRGPDADLLPQALAWGERCQPPYPAEEVHKAVAGLVERELTKQSTAKATQPTTPRLSLVAKPYADIQPEPVQWLWPERIALGKLSLLVGQPGLGKTFLACDLAARVSRGTAFPDSSLPPAGEAAIVTAEDGAADTLRPRLDAAGADVGRVQHIEHIRADDGKEMFLSLSDHLPQVDDWLAIHPEAKLLVVDPISAFLGDVDSHRNAEVRSVLGPVAKLAEKHNVAIVGVTHLSKKDAKAINRVIGSIAFVAAARAAWLVAPDPDDESGERRLFLQVKNNLGKASGLAFAITDGRVVWEEGPVLVSADEIEDDGEGSPRAEAKAWLQELLTDGPVPAASVWKRAKADGIAERTLKRAKKEQGIISDKQGEHWAWRLPEEGGSYVF